MLSRKLIISIITVAVVVAIAAAYIDWDELLTVNPPLNTAISAHGDTDWHIDTAEEFLFGTDMDGVSTAANYAPDSWTKNHMHVDLTYTNHFYYDSDLTSPGDDTDNTSGIDQNMLFFYTGHGHPEFWHTLGNDAVQDDMNLGDGPSGLLRYFWQCSCETFAHGPRNCASASFVYACPEDFDGSSDSNSMRNVYERWGTVLGDDLRLACGVSTDAWCHEFNVNRIWDNYNNNGMDVADSFIDGLGRSGVVPLCMTTGRFFTNTTPLYDETFTNLRNPGGAYIHIQYPAGFDTNTPPMVVHEPPELIPIFELIPIPPPEPWMQIKFVEKDGLLISPETVGDRGPRMRINPVSGAMYIRGARETLGKAQERTYQDYITLAMKHLQQNGWAEEMATEPVGTRFLIDSIPREGKTGEIARTQKNVTVKLLRLLEIEGRKVPVYGDGGVISVQMNNDGSLQNAHKVWRKINAVKRKAKVKPFEKAEKEAMMILGDKAEGYKVAEWTWGYKEQAGNVEQKILDMIYLFDFRAKKQEEVIKYPPRMVEIAGALD